MSIFYYTKREIESLISKDEILGDYILQVGKIHRETNKDTFASLVSSIVSQQISRKAAETVNERLRRLCIEVTPSRIASLTLEEIQKCGMTMKKAEYIIGAARAATDGTIDFKKLPRLSDAEIIKALSSLSGVGVWTAEMLLIFSLNRMDVLSYNDLAIRRGIMRLYGLEKLEKSFFNELRARYSPYNSVASLYLWDLAGKVNKV